MNRTKWLRDLLVSLTIVVMVGVVLAALGPFGSFAAGDFATRLTFWLPAILVGYLVFRPIVWIGDRAAAALSLPRLAALAGAVLLAAVPGTAAIAWLGGSLDGGPVGVSEYFPLYLNVALIGAIVTAIFVSLEQRGGVALEPPTAATLPAQSAAMPDSSRPPFHDRLPPGWSGRLDALEMEDHYVRAHGPEGRSELILMRMADAVRELQGVDGLQVHRSWWIARAAVVGSRRDGRNMRLRLRDGREVPVARDRVASVRAAGLLR